MTVEFAEQCETRPDIYRIEEIHECELHAVSFFPQTAIYTVCTYRQTQKQLDSMTSQSITISLHKLAMEPTYPADPLCAGRQKRGSEMQRARFLAEAGARHDADPRCIEEFETVEFVGGFSFGFGGGDGFTREVYGWEEVEGALCFLSVFFLLLLFFFCRVICVMEKEKSLTCGSPISTPSISLKAR